MSHEVRACASAEELRLALRPIWHYFGRSGPPTTSSSASRASCLTERMLGAWEDGEVVGGAGAFPFLLTVPGGRVRAAGITAVGVLPTHRRRGILRSMMRAQLDACRDRGEPSPTSGRPRTRSTDASATASRRSRPRSSCRASDRAYYAEIAPAGRAHLVPLDKAEPFISPVYERVAIDDARDVRAHIALVAGSRAERSGVAARRRRRAPVPVPRARDGSPAAYALYRNNWGSDRGVPTGAVDVIEAMGLTPEATRSDLALPARHGLDGAHQGPVSALGPSPAAASRRASPAALQPPRRALGSPRGRRRRAGRSVLHDGGLCRDRHRRRVLPVERRADGASARAASSGPRTRRIFAATSRPSARSTSAASPGRSSRGRCVSRSGARARSRGPTGSFAPPPLPGAPRFSDGASRDASGASLALARPSRGGGRRPCRVNESARSSPCRSGAHRPAS